MLPPPEVIRRTADDVVSRPHYELDHAPVRDSSSIWIELLRWLAKPIRYLAEALQELPDFARWLVVIVLALAAAALIAHIIYTLVTAIRGPAARLRRDFSLTSTKRDPHALEAAAEESGAEGDYIGAIRLLFRAAMIRIEEAEERPFRPGFTNRDLLRRYGATKLGRSLEQFVETIDRKWYGNEQCDSTDYMVCQREHGRIREAIRERGNTVAA